MHRQNFPDSALMRFSMLLGSNPGKGDPLHGEDLCPLSIVEAILDGRQPVALSYVRQVQQFGLRAG
jgi:hypothetical protein